MTVDGRLSLKTVEIVEEDEKYGFRIFPMLQNNRQLVLSEDEKGMKVIGSGDRRSPLKVEKRFLEALPHAYIYVREGNVKGTPVRIPTKPPEVLWLSPKEGGMAEIVMACSEYAEAAELDIVALKDGEEIGSVKLEPGVSEFHLSHAGIACLTETAVCLSVSYQITDPNGTSVFSPVNRVDFVVNPPKPMRVSREQGQVCLTVAEAPGQPLYARFYKNGREFYGAEECIRLGQKKYAVSTELLNFDEGDYGISYACKSGNTISYWSEQVPLKMQVPRVLNTRLESGRLKVRLTEEGCYLWQGKYVRAAEVELAEGERSEICYGDSRNGVESVGVPLKLPEDGFYQRDGYYLKDGRQSFRVLKQSYTPYENDSFAVKQQDGLWRLLIKEDCRESVCEDFRRLLEKECTEHAQMEELCSCFDEMPVRMEDMLPIRYGYMPEHAACDIHEGMLICFDSVQGAAGTEDPPLQRRRCEYACILREGRIAFVPFLQDAAGAGSLTVEPPGMDSEGRITAGFHIGDTLFKQFPAPFARLLYPAIGLRRGSDHDEGLFYYDNICIVSADSYERLEKATECFRNRKPPLEDAAYVCFGEWTVVELKICIFVDGQPQTCPLGTLLGDVAASYGMSGELRLERLAGNRYLPMVNGEAGIPLYKGDRICCS